jgi:hypothetical protein
VTMYRMKLVFLACGIGLAIYSGCSKATPSTSSSSLPNAVAADGSKYLLSSEPGEATEVIEAREVAQDGDLIVVVGRIGGSADPWIQDRAAFWIVDGSLKACSDIPGDKCEKPWDYCCETHKLPQSTALVKVVDDKGELVKANARALLGVRELSTVVVQGTAKRDESGNLTILARGIFVRS